MIASDDYYAILGVGPNAANAVIRAAYRNLMRRYHPDVNASVEADARAKAINEAYACLRDASRRAHYDWQRNGRSAPSRPAGVPRPRPPQRPAWTGPVATEFRATPKFELSWWKAAGLGIATLITIITFTITSATPPADSYAAKPGIDVTMRAATPAAGTGVRAVAGVTERRDHRLRAEH